MWTKWMICQRLTDHVDSVNKAHLWVSVLSWERVCVPHLRYVVDMCGFVLLTYSQVVMAVKPGNLIKY